MKQECPLLRPADVAALLGVTTNRVYQMISRGTIPVVRSGRSILIPRDVWEAWLAGLSSHAVSAAAPENHASDDVPHR